MKKLVCAARIPDQEARRKVFEWVRQVANGGYSEREDWIHLVYTEDPADKDSNSKYWAIVHWFEQYPEHEITQKEVKNSE